MSNSVCSRWPIAVIPKALYLMSEDSINLTVAAATREIMLSFNRLSTMGVKLKEPASFGGGLVSCHVYFLFSWGTALKIMNKMLISTISVFDIILF